jgi:hypothetical protein
MVTPAAEARWQYCNCGRRAPTLQRREMRTDTVTVLYFYEKEEALLQCEVRNTAVPGTFAIVLTEPDGRVRTHYVTGSNDAHRLWLEIEQQLRATGWSGPVGQALAVRR